MQLTSDDLILILIAHPVIQATIEESNTTLPILHLNEYPLWIIHFTPYT